jgi:Pyridoxamine 5'-phosphate oxidase
VSATRVSWAELESAAPAVAASGAHRLDATRVALIGTIRRDGSPRISPMEPYLGDGRLLFGAMSWSRKAHDLSRDPRCVLHSPITAPDAGEPELKLYGEARAAAAEIRDGCARGWWHAHPREAAVVFELAIEQAVLIEWKLQDEVMVLRRWSARDGLSETRRAYP